jgi:hypothetical protein
MCLLLSPQAVASRSWSRLYGHAVRLVRLRWRHWSTGLSIPQLELDGEHIDDFRGRERPLCGVGRGAMGGGARGAATAERLDG